MDHIQRLNQTIDYIEANLDKVIHLDLLAKKFALSKYHFHRIFTALIGDPPFRYIEKRRLSRAATALVDTDQRIVDIAFEYGFNSHEAFIRAFKKRYSLTPSRFRKVKPTFRRYDRCPVGDIQLKLQQGTVKLEPDIILQPDITLAGLTYCGQKTDEIFKLWQQFWSMVGAGQLELPASRCLGACLHDIDMRNKEVFIYYAGFPAPSRDNIPKTMKWTTIPAGTYAVFTHTGPLSEIEQTYDRIYASWFPRTGNTPTMDLDIIQFDHRRINPTQNSLIQILIPIQSE